jgi:hypothetical protein
MFMFTSTHEAQVNELKAKIRVIDIEYTYIISKHNKLLREWNALIKLINSKGGQDFLDSTPNTSGFTQAEIKSLIYLCHPDKHQQKPSAIAMTQKLLSMRTN